MKTLSARQAVINYLDEQRPGTTIKTCDMARILNRQIKRKPHIDTYLRTLREYRTMPRKNNIINIDNKKSIYKVV